MQKVTAKDIYSAFHEPPMSEKKLWRRRQLLATFRNYTREELTPDVIEKLAQFGLTPDDLIQP
jgi:hypothetical protein